MVQATDLTTLSAGGLDCDMSTYRTGCAQEHALLQIQLGFELVLRWFGAYIFERDNLKQNSPGLL
jgi:hypothetical protein